MPADADASYNPREVYRRRLADFEAREERYDHRARQLSSARLVVFLGALVFLVWAEMAPAGERGPLVALAGFVLAGFAALVVYHQRTRDRARWHRQLRRVNEETLHRLDRAWNRLPVPEGPDATPDHPYAADLDLFGRASLAQLLGDDQTPGGRATLRRWLLSPAPPDRVRARQQAVRELAGCVDLRDELAARARLDTSTAEDVEHFLDWAEDEPWLLRRPALVWASRLIPLATLALGGLGLTGTVDGSLWLAPLAAGWALLWTQRARVRQTLSRAIAREGVFRHYPDLFHRVGVERLRAPLLRHIQAAITADGAGAVRSMRRLERIRALAEARFSTFYPLLNIPTLWDLHVVFLLERWQRRAGRHVRGWFDALAETEALAALAGLAHAEPGWAFPEIRENAEPIVSGTELGHPLLPDDVRVGNDVTVGPPGTFLLVTGSNMSGKSTLLRAIGVNTVLAQAGGPVCAAAMRLAPVSVHTSIRVQDSLEEGVSFFLAELKRLKQVVEAGRALDRAGGPTLLYLLDEMLQGTNAEERRIAARRILGYLLDCGAIGAVTTHDLRLAEAPELQAAAHPVHFRETVRREAGEPVMSFDYTLRPGLATSTNALTLMEVIGLDVEESRPGG